jgi:hypothetical protein
MIQTGFESRIKVQQLIENQLPEFILDESPKSAEFLKQYYISQEYQGGVIDISENLDQYLKLDNLTPEVIVGNVSIASSITTTSEIITVSSTKGFPNKYGLLKIDDEIITYTGITTNSFTGCIRGFSGITTYRSSSNPEELVFSTSSASSHQNGAIAQNLSSLFLKEFYKKLKYTLTPGLENLDFVSDINVGNFIKEARTLYETKGTEESFRILFNILFGETPKVIDLEQFLLKPSSASYIRREVAVAEVISGNPLLLEGQTIKKSTDENTSASVSEVEIISREGKTYYKLLLFVGYDDAFPTIVGNFSITGSSKVIETVFPNAEVVTVDSTIGFPSKGTIYSGNNVITYTSKSINQFFGCGGILEQIDIADTIRSNETYYGYENGDTTKKVELRLTGVLSKFVTSSQTSQISVGEEIEVKHIGEIIDNPIQNKTYKEIFANSWIYNTSSRYQIEERFTAGNISQVNLKSTIDKSSLKVGDTVEILNRDTDVIIASNLEITTISGKEITTNNSFDLVQNSNYDVRRKLNKSTSSVVPLEFNNITSDIQNVYNENDEYMYVASNSLPSYQITKNIFSYNASSVSSQDSLSGLYSVINFTNKVSFITGNEIYYLPQNSPISGLSEGSYYVEVLSGNEQIRLYPSISFIGSGNYIQFGELTAGTHTFVLNSQKENIISAQKIVRKFPLSINFADGKSDDTVPGSVGMLINGVEINSYNSNDKVYYGALESVNVLNGGSGYDVINPPLLSPSSGISSIQAIVRGSIEKIYVNPQDFDVDVLVSVSLTGGNGTGASFNPIIETRRREIEFDAKELQYGGGLDISNETITFSTSHNLVNGQPIIYDPVNNSALGIGNFGGLNIDSGNTLKSGATYYTKFISNTTIQIYQTLLDYNSGINTVGFTTIGASGIHKFKTEPTKTLTSIQVVNGGNGYENRKLRVNPSGISTTNNTVTFINHGFNEGELVSYDYETSSIIGLSTTNQYRVIKIDNDSFRLSDAGIGGTNTSYYDRVKYVRFGSQGSGYQIFNYPQISLNINYTSSGIGSTSFRGSIVATPIIKGEIVGTYVYNGGYDYGATTLNVHKKPNITIKNGKEAQFSPVIVNGEIVSVSVLYGGLEYYSTPDLIIYGDGIGATLRPIVIDNKITDVIVINSGSGYTSNRTSIIAKSAGQNAFLDPQVRSLSVNNNILFAEIDTDAVSNEILKSSSNNLQYSICAYSELIKTNLKDIGSVGGEHSIIIGWAYDGNPIYGPFGYSNPNTNSSVKRLVSGYTLNTANISNRPSTSIFGGGFFIEDYQFTNSGDLDEYNGRFCVTPEFPNGVYAYFATSILDSFGNLIGTFPYFIGKRYRSKFIEENKTLNQSFDFNNSKLVRNTFPYKVSDLYAGNDFIVESNEIINQRTIVESINSNSIDGLSIISSGSNYKVGDSLNFDNANAGGSGLSAQISSILGKEIVNLQTSVTSYNRARFIWNNGNEIKVVTKPQHTLNDLDYVNISGFSTSLSEINGFYQIGVTSYTSTVVKDIPTYAISGIVTDIYVSSIPSSISIGSSVKVESETLSIINIFADDSIIRVVRESTGLAHTATTNINYIPDSFTINKKTDYFDSKINDLVYFNPSISVGVGTTPGIGITYTYPIGTRNLQISVPTQSIYLPNHPFETNQAVTFTKPSTVGVVTVSNTSSGSIFSLPNSGNSQTVYVIKKSNDYIGIVTQTGLTTTSDGLFFRVNGSNDYRYSFESNFEQIKGNIQKTSSTISISTAHGLSNNDNITLDIKPNLSVGIGTSTAIVVKFDSRQKKLIFNPIDFNSSGINTLTNEITINAHNLSTGDKVIYSSSGSVASGLTTDSYFVYKVDDNTIKLCETLIDSTFNPPVVVGITTAPTATHTLKLINPPIESIKNNNLVFNLSDSSLSGYKFKIFYDNTFSDEFVSTGSTSTFTISGVGTVGVSTNASLTLNYSSDIPSNLFYALEKSGYISTADTEVKNYSRINFVDSIYNGSYRVSGVGTTTFNITLQNKPEKLSYNQSECDILKYSTKSISASGGIGGIRIISSGENYKSLPVFTGSDSSLGDGAYIVAQSSKVGSINETKILNEGFEYPSDKTLRPIASIPSNITIKNSNTITNINILSGGKNYVSAPDVIIVNPDTGEAINSGLLQANISGTGIVSINIIDSPKGLPSTICKIKTIKNSNGVGIQSVESSSTGIVTCYLTTPASGFTIEPFAIGDSIFVEGIQKYSSSGDGFNSQDYEYEFFKVIAYDNGGTSSIRKLKYSVSGLTTNPGFAKTNQDFYATIVNYNNYPTFEVFQDFSPFIVGEKLLVNSGIGFVEQDLKISAYNKDSIKVYGNYELNLGDIIQGIQSGNLATIEGIEITTGEFLVDYSSKQKLGWSDNTGKLDDDTQVIPDNNYYQNLSYSIKSNQEWENIVTPVNSLLHTSGLKNFADTQIIKNVDVGISSVVSVGTTTSIIILYDIIDENRVDTINNFDLVNDIDVVNESSRYLKLKTKKLSDYIECRTNRVLEIDDFSSEFLTADGNTLTYSNIVTISPSEKYNRFLVQAIDYNNTQIQFTELVVMNNDDDIFTLEKGYLSSVGSTTIQNKIVDIYGYKDDISDEYYLRFEPSDPFNTDYKIKILTNNFTTYFSGIGTTSIGFTNLTSSSAIVSSATTSTLVSISTSLLKSIYSNIHVLNTNTNEMNYVELYVDHDGIDTYISQFYFDSDSKSNPLSGSFIGSFGASISPGGILSLNYTNNTPDNVTIRSKNVGFGTTSVGIGTYRFKLSGQIDGNERTVKYDSSYVNVSTASTILSFDKTQITSVKSIIRVSIGKTSALHQVMVIADSDNTFTLQYPFLSIGSTTGIGTFGAELSGNNANLKFYPSPGISGTIEVLNFNESFYKDIDTVNIPPSLQYGNNIESVNISQYFGKNSTNLNKTDFDANYQYYPIFMKTFNPSDSATLNLATGEFSIDNHFFSTGEELIYRPTSTFIGIGATSVGIGSTLNSVGVVTDRLPTTVFAYKVNNDKFKLSTRKEYAASGICVTFTSVGTGNAHQLEMVKKNEKTIISIDNIIQYPISYSLISATLNNGGQIGASSTIFALSGISSIKVNDLLKIDSEYVQVNNVGLGTTNIGPISFTGGTPLVQVTRGFVGSSATTHTDLSSVGVYRGSYNIVGNTIYFTEAPKGINIDSNSSNLPAARAYFNGRVFLKKDYTSNQIYDNISEKFTGISTQYILTSQGINTVGLGTSGGNGIVVINGIFQTPTTQNNINNNFTITENTSSGISSVRFSGITSSNGSVIISQTDINLNQLPRGGIIVSLGSTPGLGYAPLVGASVTAIIGVGGSIVSIGIGTTGNWGSGYRNPVSVAITDTVGTGATITAIVGAGGTLSFTIVDGGTNYIRPTINISPPSYQNLSVTGVSRLGIGTTTDTGVGLLINVNVSASSTVGIGSTLFEVSSFDISRTGYGFKKGDVITAVGLVTAYGLSSPRSQFQLTVLDTFTDSFGAWQFGEMDYIDSIKNYQDGSRTRFPLYYNSQLLSFEKSSKEPDSQLIDFDSLLIIFINGILQKPKDAYQFSGGTSFTFTEAPKIEDNVSIFFYRGSSEDSTSTDITETIKIGDKVVVSKNNNLLGITTDQNTRIVSDITASDTLQTLTYTESGIDEVNLKPINWTKQKVDMFVDGNVVSKSRDSIESQIYPTAKIIGNITTTDPQQLFVDSKELFAYDSPTSFNGLIISGNADPVSAAVTAIVSVAGTIRSLSITNPGSGYTGSSVTVKIAAPLTIGISTSLPMGVGIGIGTTATATITVSAAGTLTTPITITNPGLGYSIGMEPRVLVPLPSQKFENISKITTVEGRSGNIVGIATTVGIGTALAIKFTLSSVSDLSVGYPIYIFDTRVGNGVTSIYTTNASIVGVGTTFLDNIYSISGIDASVGIITCNVASNTSIVGIATTGTLVGKFSWGRLSGFTRGSSPISIGVTGFNVDAGLSTFPTIQRRGYGLRNIGPIKKTL